MYLGLKNTNFEFKNCTQIYKGKVRDVYFFGNKIVVVATDRISAFDVILPNPIPYKGQVLNQIAALFLEQTKDIVPNWLEKVPAPNVSIGKNCKPFAVEMVIRGYLAGHSWREYKSGKRNICGNTLPDGLKENDKLPMPIITPTTKAKEGHDEDISKNEIIHQNIIDEKTYKKLENYTFKLFERGTQLAKQKGLILVDTKYEFGIFEDEIYLIDEVHTPDSSRYFYADTYQDLLNKNQPQRQLSKEFVREWLMANNFQGKEGQKIPNMDDAFIQLVSNRYIELYEKITGQNFQPFEPKDLRNIIEKNI